MKLSDVEVVNKLIARRTSLVEAYVLTETSPHGLRTGVAFLDFCRMEGTPSIFGVGVDDGYIVDLRSAFRLIIRRQITENDARLATMGIELDDVEIAIAEEQAKAAAAKAEKAKAANDAERKAAEATAASEQKAA